LVDYTNIHQKFISEDADNHIEVVKEIRIYFADFSDKDKEQAWKDLLELTKDEDSYVQWSAVDALGLVLQHVTEKEQAWRDLLALIKEIEVQWHAAKGVCAAFQHLKDKDKAWEDLLALTEDKDFAVRYLAVYELGVAFQYMPDKEQAAKDLLALAKDVDSIVLKVAANALGQVFPYMPDKEQAVKNLLALTKDDEREVRLYANYSLGKISIYRATDAKSEESLKEEMVKAIEYFEKSSYESKNFNMAEFCLPFYRSYNAVIFKKEDTNEEIERNLEEAKRAVAGSKSKEKLLQAIENLANALQEAQKLRGLDEIKTDLNAYRRYCDRAEELLDETEDKAPGAAKLVRRGLPIIDERIKEILNEIEENAKKFCKDTQQTPFKIISRNIFENVKGLGEEQSCIKADKIMDEMVPLLISLCSILPEESESAICNQLTEMKYAEMDYKGTVIVGALSNINVQVKSLEEKIEEKDKLIEYFEDIVKNKLDNISYGIFKLKIRSASILPDLQKIQDELKKLEQFETDIKNLRFDLTKLSDVQNQNFLSLNMEMLNLTEEIKINVVPRLPHSDSTDRIIEMLEDFEKSKGENWFHRVASLSSIIGLIITVI